MSCCGLSSYIWVNTNCFATDTPGLAILGLPSCKKFKIVQMNFKIELPYKDPLYVHGCFSFCFALFLKLNFSRNRKFFQLKMSFWKIVFNWKKFLFLEKLEPSSALKAPLFPSTATQPTRRVPQPPVQPIKSTAGLKWVSRCLLKTGQFPGTFTVHLKPGACPVSHTLYRWPCDLMSRLNMATWSKLKSSLLCIPKQMGCSGLHTHAQTVEVSVSVLIQKTCNCYLVWPLLHLNGGGPHPWVYQGQIVHTARCIQWMLVLCPWPQFLIPNNFHLAPFKVFTFASSLWSSLQSRCLQMKDGQDPWMWRSHWQWPHNTWAYWGMTWYMSM